MVTFHPLIYILAFLGIFFEGEFAFISVVVAAENTHLSLPIAIITGFMATFTADCFYFFLGRKKGSIWLDRNPTISKKVAKARHFISKNELMMLLSYRYLYGLRTLIPLVLGTLNTSKRKFLVFSFFGTLIWTAFFSMLGIVLNRTILGLLSEIEHVEKYLIAVLIFLAVAFSFFKFLGKNQFPFHKKPVCSSLNKQELKKA